jgi:hypothetical protein
MLARVTTFEGGTPEGIRAAAEEMRANIPKGPPPGIKSNGITMLVDPDGGRVMVIGLFADQDDLSASESVFAEMSPAEGMGSRSSIDVYEVAAEARL